MQEIFDKIDVIGRELCPEDNYKLRLFTIKNRQLYHKLSALLRRGESNRVKIPVAAPVFIALHYIIAVSEL
eukprot:scaffold249313_cov74-Cyclotella_meneghiniana.AAC.3